MLTSLGVCREAEIKAQAVGEGVTQEAQNIYDSLAKTLPCRWEDKGIIVLDEVCRLPCLTGRKRVIEGR